MHIKIATTIIAIPIAHNGTGSAGNDSTFDSTASVCNTSARVLTARLRDSQARVLKTGLLHL